MESPNPELQGIVHEINGLTWRDPLQGHGGWAGDQPLAYHRCDGTVDSSCLNDAANPPMVGVFGDIWLPGGSAPTGRTLPKR